jgi:hypothetical protein
LDNPAACSFATEENRLTLKVSRSDFELIKRELEENHAKQKRLTIIRIEIMPADIKIKAVVDPVEQLTGSILLRLEHD